MSEVRGAPMKVGSPLALATQVSKSAKVFGYKSGGCEDIQGDPDAHWNPQR